MGWDGDGGGRVSTVGADEQIKLGVLEKDQRGLELSGLIFCDKFGIWEEGMGRVLQSEWKQMRTNWFGLIFLRTSHQKPASFLHTKVGNPRKASMCFALDWLGFFFLFVGGNFQSFFANVHINEKQTFSTFPPLFYFALN